MGISLGGVSVAPSTALLALLAVLALAPLPDTVLGMVLGLCGICVIDGQTAINVSAGLIDPVAMRARSSARRSVFGRLGSILGPLVGGVLVAFGHGARTLFWSRWCRSASRFLPSCCWFATRGSTK